MFKVSKGIGPSVFSNMFTKMPQINYSLMHKPDFIIPRVKSVHNGAESITVLGPKIWEMVPKIIKEK